MTTGEEAVFALLDLLNEREIPYMLVGSFSSNAWGEPRSTKDADFVVQLTPAKRSQLFSRLPKEIHCDDQISFETITGHTRQILQIPSVPFEIELFDLSDEPFDQSRFSRRLQTTMGGRTVFLPTAEDVVTQKLRWAQLGKREKDFLDALGVARIRTEKLDWSYIEHWCQQLGIERSLDRLRQQLAAEN